MWWLGSEPHKCFVDGALPQPLDAYFCLRSAYISSRMIVFESWGSFYSYWDVCIAPLLQLGPSSLHCPSGVLRLKMACLVSRVLSSGFRSDLFYMFRYSLLLFCPWKETDRSEVQSTLALPENQSLVPREPMLFGSQLSVTQGISPLHSLECSCACTHTYTNEIWKQVSDAIMQILGTVENEKKM